MSTILKGATFGGVRDNNHNKKKGNGYHKLKGDARQGLKGPGTSAAGPFRKEKPPVQCYQCMGWGHYARNCPNEYPVEGSINWGNQKGEVAKQGGYSSPTGQCHPDPDPSQGSSSATGSARAITSTVSKRVNKGGLLGGGYVLAPEYHNPDPLVRLIGPANEGKVKIEGVENHSTNRYGSLYVSHNKKLC